VARSLILEIQHITKVLIAYRKKPEAPEGLRIADSDRLRNAHRHTARHSRIQI